jgi:hypothetical protein
VRNAWRSGNAQVATKHIAVRACSIVRLTPNTGTKHQQIGQEVSKEVYIALPTVVTDL